MLNRSRLTAYRLPFDDLNEFAEGERLNDLNGLNGFPCWEVIDMRRVMNKLARMPAELVRSQRGFSVLVVVFVMLVLSAIGYSMVSMMASKQKSVPITAQSSSAFYMAEAGINWAGKYLSDLRCWNSIESEKTLGSGTFTIASDSYCSYGNCEVEGGTYMCVSVISTGTYGDATRVLRSRFCREQGEGCEGSEVSCPD